MSRSCTVLCFAIGLIACIGIASAQLITPWQACEMKCLDELTDANPDQPKDNFYDGCKNFCFAGENAFDYLYRTTIDLDMSYFTTTEPTQ